MIIQFNVFTPEGRASFDESITMVVSSSDTNCMVAFLTTVFTLQDCISISRSICALFAQDGCVSLDDSFGVEALSSVCKVVFVNISFPSKDRSPQIF